MRAELKQLEGSYAVARLSADAPIPDWAPGRGFVSFSRSEDDVSIVCLADRVPEDVESDRGWTCFRSLGLVGLEQAGFILSVVRPLSENDIGVFLTSTFAGDHFLVKSSLVPRAKSFLRAAGHACFP